MPNIITAKRLAEIKAQAIGRRDVDRLVATLERAVGHLRDVVGMVEIPQHKEVQDAFDWLEEFDHE